jgi:hypothetical protein
MRSVTASLPFVFAALLAAQDTTDPAVRGFRPLFDGSSLAGWHGQRHVDPTQLAALPVAERDRLLAEDAASMRAHWRVEAGELVNDGHGAYLTSDAAFGDAEYLLEYRTVALADSGIYLRGCPQVQIWDATEAGGKWQLGADKGSGGLWNNERNERFPPRVADRPFGEWNRLAIVQIGATTWVTLNDVVTVDGVVMENYWDRKRPLPATGPLQLQTHGGEIRFRNLWVRAIPPAEANTRLANHRRDGFVAAFDGKTFAGWTGDRDSSEVADGAIRCRAGKGGNLVTEAVHGDFVARLEFLLPPGGNNGLAIRYLGNGDPAYAGCELQVLDDSAPKYADLKPWQFHGSVYGVVPSHRGYQRAVGEWNFQEVTVRGSRVTVVLNGTPIVDADLAGLPSQLGAQHTGLQRTEGHFGFCGHGDAVAFRHILLRSLAPAGK